MFSNVFSQLYKSTLLRINKSGTVNAVDIFTELYLPSWCVCVCVHVCVVQVLGLHGSVHPAAGDHTLLHVGCGVRVLWPPSWWSFLLPQVNGSILAHVVSVELISSLNLSRFVHYIKVWIIQWEWLGSLKHEQKPRLTLATITLIMTCHEVIWTI